MTTHAPEGRPRGRAIQNTLLVILLAIVLGIGALVAFGIKGLTEAVPSMDDIQAAFAPEPYQEIGPVVIESVKNMAELTTVEVTEYTIVEKGIDAGWLEWARGDSIRLLAVASIGAGVDLSALTTGDFTVSSGGDVTVRVPGAELLYVDVDGEATQVLDREIGLLTKGDPRLETETRSLAETVLVDKAMEEGLLEKAEDNATSILTNLLQSLGYERVSVQFVG